MPPTADQQQIARSTSISGWETKPFLQKVTDVVPSVIYIFNHATQSNEYTNRSVGDALGLTELEVRELGDALMPRLCHPEDLPRVLAHFRDIQQLEDGAVATLEYRVRHRKGHWVWLLSRDTVFQRNNQGNVLRHIGVASDITAQKEAEHRARKQKINAETVSDEFRAFSYAMSHDLKSPSNTLGLLLDELLESHGAALPSDAKDLIEMAQATTRHLSTLVNDVNDYTGLIGGETERRKVDLNQVLAGVTDDMRMLMAQRRAEVDIGTLPVVLGDIGQLGLYFRNLLDNALKFRRRGITPQIKVSSVRSLDGAMASITVADNGIGIDPENHEKIFTIFKRLNPTLDYAGSGLGLAVCRRIAANHGDRITLVSSPGKGAAFTLRLPVP